MTRRAAMGAMAVAFCSRASAMGRVPIDGKIQLRVPWRLARLDPHDLFDPVAAIFAGAIADTAYARDAQGRVYPALADGMPYVEDGQTIVKLRPDLRSAAGKAIGGSDLAWSVRRARERGAGALFAQHTPFVKSDPDAALIARFGEADPGRLALLLSSPLTAILPVAFDPSAPDGTGALKARAATTRLQLTRNPNASRGPSFLEGIDVLAAADLADSLRSFETGKDDLGWLGLGFHNDRRGARRFDHGLAAWVVLVTGKRAGRFAAPGVAQQLANHVPIERLHVGVQSARGGAGTGWRNGAATLIHEDQPHLRAIAEAVATKLGDASNEVTPKALSHAAFRQARTSEDFALAIDLVRPLGVPGSDALALATADRPALGLELGKQKIWPRGAPASLTTNLRLGVLGNLSLSGGVAASILLAAEPSGGIAWGASYRFPA
jgi:peptide/nickel transport system substrate-binding protein